MSSEKDEWASRYLNPGPEDLGTGWAGDPARAHWVSVMQLVELGMKRV